MAPADSTARLERLECFLEGIRRQVYPEPRSELHESIAREMLDRVLAAISLPPGRRVLDVGCGKGFGLRCFRESGHSAAGVTIAEADLEACRAQGHEVYDMDQSFLTFADGEFDLVWCRHCLEHSVFPLFTLVGFQRVLKPGGYLYVEAPAPDTANMHQRNGNHYSVLGKSMWRELLVRAGFTVANEADIRFETAAGPDLYWAFICARI